MLGPVLKTWLPGDYGLQVSRRQAVEACKQATIQNLVSVRLDKIVRSKDYSVCGDEIYVTVRFDEEAIDKILTENESAWSFFIKERYSDREGFFSYYSNDIKDWDDWAGHKHKCGQVICFLKDVTDEMQKYGQDSSNAA